jgi:hypothetical protein
MAPQGEGVDPLEDETKTEIAAIAAIATGLAVAVEEADSDGRRNAETTMMNEMAVKGG